MFNASRIVLRHKELILYCVIGCSGATLDFLVYVALTKLCGLHYQAANFISVSCGIVNNFFLNCFFNFKVRDNLLVRLSSFYCVGMLGWVLSAACLWFLIERLHANGFIAKLGTIFFVTVIQFCLNKFITFRKRADV